MRNEKIFFVLIICFLCGRSFVNAQSGDNLSFVKEQFANPPGAYRPTPFFVWNNKITESEIDWMMQDFKDKGFGGVFVHARPGLITEYLSDEWFALFKYTTEKGKELNLNVWIYDENSYPSGFAGGHVPNEMPESYDQGIGLKMTKCDRVPGDVSRCYICLKEETGLFKDITFDIKNEIGKPGVYYLFEKTYPEKTPFFGGYSYVDLLLPGVTEKFLDITMTGYERVAGVDFGKTIPGVFFDEPYTRGYGGIRWTPDLFEQFQKLWGYDLKENLPSLFEEVGNWKRIRHNYQKTILRLFIDRWAKPYYEYATNRNLILTGHYWEHIWPDVERCADNMAMYAWMQMPGIDLLFNEFDDRSPNAQFGNVRAVKELSSAANQTGRKRTLSETYGGAGWEETFFDFKRLGDWEFALGVNFMNQHLSHISLEGARKYDYPTSFSYHEPWWKYYRSQNDYFGRLSLALSSGKQENSILIIEPTTSVWMHYQYNTKGTPRGKEIAQSFQSFVTRLEKAQVEYDLGSEDIIKDRGTVKDKMFVVGNAAYTTVVIPPDCENLDKETTDLLTRFVENGGRILAYSVPERMDGNRSDIFSLLFKQSPNVTFLSRLTDEDIAAYFGNETIRFGKMNGNDVYHHRRKLTDGNIVFLCNSNTTENASGEFTISGKDAIEADTETGMFYDYPEKETNSKVTLTFDLPPAGSKLFFISDKKISGLNARKNPIYTEVVNPSGSLKIKRLNENVLNIDFCDLSVSDIIYKDINVLSATDTVFKKHGFPKGNPWFFAVQYKTEILDKGRYDSGGFTATYTFNIKDVFDYSDIKAVIERSEIWKVSINGKQIDPSEEWWLDRSFAVFKIGDLLKQGENTLSLTVAPMNVLAEIEPVYILGNFSVFPADKGFTIHHPQNPVVGSWKRQGMPFYFGQVSYSQTYDIENISGNYAVELNDPSGTICEVAVNGISGGTMISPPYRSDITSLLKKGENKIEIIVTGSLKNLLGPHHNDPPLNSIRPFYWQGVKNYPSGNDYRQLDYGLTTDFKLIHGSE